MPRKTDLLIGLMLLLALGGWYYLSWQDVRAERERVAPFVALTNCQLRAESGVLDENPGGRPELLAENVLERCDAQFQAAHPTYAGAGEELQSSLLKGSAEQLRNEQARKQAAEKTRQKIARKSGLIADAVAKLGEDGVSKADIVDYFADEFSELLCEASSGQNRCFGSLRGSIGG